MGDDAKITINTKDVTYGPGATVGGIASPQYEYTFDPLDSMSLGSTTSDITISMPEYTDDNWPSEKKRRYFRATYFPPFDQPKLLKNGEIIQLTPENYNQL